MPKSDCWTPCCFFRIMKYQTLLKVASGSHTVSFCSFQLTVVQDFLGQPLKGLVYAQNFMLSLSPQRYVVPYEDKAH